MTTSESAAARWTRRHVADGSMPEAVLGVADSTGTLLLDGFGVGADARFALFSITKPLVALAAVRAIEEGLLTSQQPLEKSVPGFGAGHEASVTLEHLLSHTAGLAEPPLDDARPLRPLLEHAPQAFLPGRAVRYSSLAFEGVAAMLEHATGDGLETRLRSVVERTTGQGLGFDLLDARPVVGLERAGFDLDAMVRNRHPGAGLFGTARDLLELGTELLRTLGGHGSGLLHEASLRTMLRVRTAHLPWAVPEPERRDFGLGWQVREASAGVLDRSTFGHAGWSGTQWWIAPDSDRVVVLLTGVADFGTTGLDADELLNAATVGSIRP